MLKNMVRKYCTITKGKFKFVWEEIRMEKWRCISLIGIILGIGIQIIDFFVISIPYVIFIPLEFVAIILIFAGFIIRKKQK